MTDEDSPPKMPPPEPEILPDVEERVEVIINERVYKKGDSVGIIRKHVHTAHNLGQRITGPAPSGLEFNNLWVHYCEGCHLTWFEVIPNTPIQFQAQPKLFGLKS